MKTCQFRRSALTAAALLYSSAAFSQEIGDLATDTDGSAEIVVVGRKFLTESTASSTKLNQSIVEAPQSITVFDASLLDDLSLSDYFDAIAYVPGAQVGGSTYGAYNEAAIRGYGLGQKVNAQSLAGSGIIDQVAIDRIEFVRGASGTTFGASGPGGYINLITRKAGRDFAAKGSAEIQSFGRYRVEGSVEDSITGDGSVRGLVAGSWEGKGTYLARAERETRALFSSLEVAVSDELSASASVYYGKDVYSPFNFGIPAQTRFDANGNVTSIGYFSGLPRRFDISPSWSRSLDEKVYAQADLTYKINSDLTAYLVYSRSTSRNRSKGLDICCNIEENGDIQQYSYAELNNGDNEAIEVRISGDINHPLGKTQFLLNGEISSTRFSRGFSDYSPIAVTNNVLNPVIDPVSEPDLPYTFSTRAKSKFKAVALTTITELGSFSLTLGARYDAYKISDESFLGSFGERESQQNRNGDKLSYRAALSYEIDTNLHTYYSFNQSFIPQGDQLCSGASAPPFTANIHEIGLKFKPNPKLLFAVSAYDIKTSPALVRLPALACLPTTVAFAEAFPTSSRGLELEMTGNLTPRLNIIASYAYTNARTGELIDPDLPDPTIASNRIDVQTTRSAKHQAAIFAAYDFPVSHALGGLGLGAGAKYIGPRYLTGGPVDVNRWRVGSNLSIDGSIYYKISNNIRSTFSVSNVFNSIRYESAVSSTEFQAYVNEGRAFRLRVDFEF